MVEHKTETIKKLYIVTLMTDHTLNCVGEGNEVFLCSSRCKRTWKMEAKGEKRGAHFHFYHDHHDDTIETLKEAEVKFVTWCMTMTITMTIWKESSWEHYEKLQHFLS